MTTAPHRARARALALLAVLLLALLGAADGLYLSLVHIDLELGAGGIGRICHALARDGCEVTAGRYGALFGLPIALYGAAGALATAAAALFALFQRRHPAHPAPTVVFALALVGALASCAMALISALEGSFCPFCLLWYLLNALILIAALTALPRPIAPHLPAALRSPATLPGLVAALIFALTLAAGARWYQSAHERAEAALSARIAEEVAAVLAKPRLTGLAPGDNPRQRHGPASADSDVITIYEFSDFECPYCAQLWTHAERAFAASPRPIEVIFVNFPLDAACNPAARAGMHEHACLAAIAGECAHRQGQFWPYPAVRRTPTLIIDATNTPESPAAPSSRVFAGQPTLDRRALLAHAADLALDQPAFTACLDDPAVLEAIRADLRLARAAGVTGTPTLIIDGYKYTGVARRPLIEALLNAVADRP
jgi:protein-disulfide isomerase/uncharacterized membrane protein